MEKRKVYILWVYIYTMKVYGLITENEKEVLRLLMTSFDVDYSINNIAKECNLAPNGAFKILKKFEQEGILKPKKIANIVSYKVDYNNEKTTNILELALISKLNGRIKHRYEDFLELKKIAKICIIFGSYANLKKEPNDLDVLFVLEKERFKEYKEKLRSISEIAPVKIHDIVQTEEDLKINLLKNDKILSRIMRKGIVLWGFKEIVKGFQNVSQKQAK